jgi:proton-translocating NADH-quinone oxidoreductase chain M
VTFPVLTALIVLPLVGAALTMLVPGNQTAKVTALGASLVTLAVTVVAALQFDLGGPLYQLTEQVSWVAPFGLYWSLGLSGISLALVALTAVATPIVLGAMWHEAEESGRSVKAFYALVLVLQSMTIGAFLSTDVLLFYILFEAMLIPMYFLIGVYGGDKRQYAAMKFLLYNLLGGLVMLAAVIGLYLQAPAGERSFLLADLVALDIDTTTQGWLFLGFMIAFAIKAPLWPLHTWLPDAATEATPSQAAYLSGVVDKVGTFGMVALVLPLFPDATRTFAPVVVTLAVISILYGGLLAIGQTDIKRIIAFSSISHFGVIVLGIFALTTLGTAGSTFYMVSHGLSTTALFVVAGLLIARRGSRQLKDFGGVQKPAPILAGFLLVAGLSGLAMPGLSTFVSEFLVLVGTFSRYQVAAALATFGIILSALYILIMYQRTMTGPTTPETEHTADVRGREAIVVAPLFVLLIALGVAPAPLLEPINDSTEQTLELVGVSDPEPVFAAEGGDQ